MQIEQLVDYHKAPMDLLLLADPSEEAIAEYLGTSTLWVAEIADVIAGIIVLQNLDQKTLEIMNLAVDERYQRRGIGRELVMTALAYAKNAGYQSVKIATGNSSFHQLKLYQSCGFKVDKIIKDYFIAHYPEPIYENGLQCRDRIELCYLCDEVILG